MNEELENKLGPVLYIDNKIVVRNITMKIIKLR